MSNWCTVIVSTPSPPPRWEPNLGRRTDNYEASITKSWEANAYHCFQICKDDKKIWQNPTGGCRPPYPQESTDHLQTGGRVKRAIGFRKCRCMEVFLLLLFPLTPYLSITQDCSPPEIRNRVHALWSSNLTPKIWPLNKLPDIDWVRNIEGTGNLRPLLQFTDRTRWATAK